MQFLSIDKSTTLAQLSNRVGARNIDSVLHLNQLSRVPNIGQAFQDLAQATMSMTTQSVGWQTKSSILNTMTGDSDVFEAASLLGSSGWKMLANLNTFPNFLKIPETFRLTDATDVMGNNQGIVNTIYQKVMSGLSQAPHTIDPSIFGEYSTINPVQLVNNNSTFASSNAFEPFKLPWGDITFYSSLAGESMDIPVYPEEVSDGVKANYTTMPELIYQYEPWQLYTSSGPRICSYSFDLHRDMWNGDHTQGGANKLIRFCMANCYPEYVGSAVNTSTVTLYVKGQSLISGILTDVSVDWDGPIGRDGWYLHFKLTLNITEVSTQPLNFNTVRNKPLIA